MNIVTKSVAGFRNENQDAVLGLERNNCFILAVADGMGGHSGGGIASKEVISICKNVFIEFSNTPSHRFIKPCIKRIFQESQHAICQISDQNDDLKGLGTTLTLAIGYGIYYAIGHIGDSRAYLWSNNKISQITKDHSFINEYKNRSSHITINEEFINQYDHLLTRCIDGKEDNGEIFPSDNSLYELLKSDVLVLCTDGLITNKRISFDSILKCLLNKSNSITEAASTLTQYALDMQSTDNISVVLGVYNAWPNNKGTYQAETIKIQSRRKRINIKKVIMVLCFILLILSICLILIKDTSLFQHNKSRIDKTYNNKSKNIIDIGRKGL